jgi:hypothetical protein
MSKKRKAARALPGAELARVVTDLFKHEVEGGPFPKEFARLDPQMRRDANAMAAVLVAMRQLLDRERDNRGGTVSMKSGHLQAYDLLDALTTGRNWTPFWHFLASLRATKRPQKALPSELEKERRSAMVGFVLALQQVDGPNGRRLKESGALREAIAACKFHPSSGVEFSADRIRGWKRHSRLGRGPETMASQIISDAEKLVEEMPNFSQFERVVSSGRRLVWGYWSVPDFGH